MVVLYRDSVTTNQYMGLLVMDEVNLKGIITVNSDPIETCWRRQRGKRNLKNVTWLIK